MDKEKDPSTVPLCQALLPVFSWMSGPVTTNMYQFDGHTVWTGTMKCCDKKVYLSLSLFLTPLSARGLAHCSTSFVSFFLSHLQLPNYLTYSAGHVEDMQSKTLACLMPLIHMLWYLDMFVVDCGDIDAVVVLDETAPMAAKMAMPEERTKVAFLAVSVNPQKDVSSALEVLCNMPSSCGTCWTTMKWSRQY